MNAQLHSTRIFNENYFALFAAMDDLVSREIKFVALPGDFSDDGQPIHLKGFKKILDQYEHIYGIQFFITTGNHDPVGPFDQDAGKNDFLGINGQNQVISSKQEVVQWKENELPAVISEDIKKSGYKGVFKFIKSFGFFPKENYLYWETPFSNFSPETYTFEKAQKSAFLEKRMYEITSGFSIPDASYLVEPTSSLWLLAIDGNVYIPKDNNKNPSDAKNYQGASIGYNNVIEHKAHLLKWIKKVSEEAKRLDKKLIAFSHYPLVDFNDDASQELRTFFGGNKWQLNRVPDEKVAELFSDAGIKIHFAGHMHINDTGKRIFSNGKSLINIQTPYSCLYSCV